MGEYVDGKSMLITQDAIDVSILTSTGDVFTGTVSGDIVEWSGSYPERNGMSDYTSASLTISADTGAGNASWTWTDGVDSCNGTMAIGVHKNALGESTTNSSAETADIFEFTDNVAFFQGSLGVGIDKYDYFSFVADADATVQIELSHFDTEVTNLDLELIDEDLRRIARSNSSDGFEMIDAAVTAGSRYYIKVTARSIDGPDTYNLAVDIN